MSKQIEALKLALEALKHGGCPPDCKDGMTDSGGVHPWGEAALIPCPNCQTITAIKEALAQHDSVQAKPEPEQEPVATVESVATVVSESGNQEVTMSWWHEPALPVGTKLYTKEQL